ncbi:MAG: amidohydrolase family protein [Deltaproteobacteria bacterium]
MSGRLVIREAFVWPAGPGLAGPVTVVVVGERIALVTGEPVPRKPGDWEVDAAGRLLLPGFVDAHAHLTRRLSLGLVDGPALGGGASSGFGATGWAYPAGHPQLEPPLRGRYERLLEPADVRASARLALAEAALAGTTAVLELLRAPGCAAGSLDLVGEAAREVGLRAAIAYGASERDGAAAVGLQECERFAREAAGERFGPLVRGALGLSGSETIGTAALGTAAELAHVHGVFIHDGETEEELAQAFTAHGMRSLERLREIGLLGEKTVALHGNQLNRREAEILAEVSGFCAFTPRAALFSEERPPRLEAVIETGAHAVLGTDGLSASVRAEGPWALALWRRTARTGAQQGYFALERMLLDGGARLAGRLFGTELGRLAPGQAADLVLLDRRPVTPLRAESICGQLLTWIAEAPVAWTIVAGRPIVREGELLTVDLGELAAQAAERARLLWRRM